MAKNNVSVLGTIFHGLKIYLFNLDIFIKYLSFPVLGTFLGIFLVFFTTYLFATNLGTIQGWNPIFANTIVILTCLLIITIPGFLIMLKAFVDYLIAMGALNSMCIMGEKRIVDVYNHEETIKRRFAPYCVLLIVLSLILGILSLPILLPAYIIAIVYLCLAIQVFTLEENCSPFEAMKKSIDAVKGNFWKVFAVLILVFIISYGIIPSLLSWFIGKIPIFNYLTAPVESYLALLPISEINTLLVQANIPYSFDVMLVAESIVYWTIATIVMMYMLPFRCACCVHLYQNLCNQQKSEPKKEKTYKKRYKKEN